MIISSIRIKYPTIKMCMSKYPSESELPFSVLYFSWWLTYHAPICFQRCTRTEMHKSIRHSKLLHYWDTIHIRHKTWCRQERQHWDEQTWNGWISVLINVSSTAFISVSWYWGCKVKETLLEGVSSFCSSHKPATWAHHLGASISYLLDLKMGGWEMLACPSVHISLEYRQETGAKVF